MDYRPLPDNCEFDHQGYDCRVMKEAYNKGTWRGHQYNQKPLPVPRYTHTEAIQPARLTKSHPSPSLDDPRHSYEYGANIHKRQRISPSETTIGDSESDSISSAESYIDQNDQAKHNIGLLLQAARVASGMTYPAFFLSI